MYSTTRGRNDPSFLSPLERPLLSVSKVSPSSSGPSYKHSSPRFSMSSLPTRPHPSPQGVGESMYEILPELWTRAIDNGYHACHNLHLPGISSQTNICTARVSGNVVRPFRGPTNSLLKQYQGTTLLAQVYSFSCPCPRLK